MNGIVVFAICIGVYLLIGFLSGLSESKSKPLRYIGYIVGGSFSLFYLGVIIIGVCLLFAGLFMQIPNIIIKASAISIVFFCSKYYIIKKFGIHAWNDIWRVNYINTIKVANQEEYLEIKKQIKEYGKIKIYVVILSIIFYCLLDWVGYEIAERVMTDDALRFFEMGKYAKDDDYDY